MDRVSARCPPRLFPSARRTVRRSSCGAATIRSSTMPKSPRRRRSTRRRKKRSAGRRARRCSVRIAAIQKGARKARSKSRCSWSSTCSIVMSTMPRTTSRFASRRVTCIASCGKKTSSSMSLQPTAWRSGIVLINGRSTCGRSPLTAAIWRRRRSVGRWRRFAAIRRWRSWDIACGRS